MRILKDDYNQYETEHEEQKRRSVSRSLQQMITEWVKDCTARQKDPNGRPKFNQDFIDKSEGKLFEFGSYRLNVHTPGTDIDALCLAPRHIERDRDFFGEDDQADSLAKRLASDTDNVTKLVQVKEGVPCIKMIYQGIDIDLLFARTEEPIIKADYSHRSLQINSILRNCDSKSIKSLNGRRVTDKIIDLVMDTETD